MRLGARHPHIKQAPFFGKVRSAVARCGGSGWHIRQQPFFAPHHKDHRKFQPLGCVQTQNRHAVGARHRRQPRFAAPSGQGRPRLVRQRAQRAAGVARCVRAGPRRAFHPARPTMRQRAASPDRPSGRLPANRPTRPTAHPRVCACLGSAGRLWQAYAAPTRPPGRRRHPPVGSTRRHPKRLCRCPRASPGPSRVRHAPRAAAARPTVGAPRAAPTGCRPPLEKGCPTGRRLRSTRAAVRPGDRVRQSRQRCESCLRSR